MPGITHRSTRPPQLKTRLLSHGTLECRDIAASRGFYEEALGLEVQAPVALFIRLGSQHCYAVVENPRAQETSPGPWWCWTDTLAPRPPRTSGMRCVPALSAP
jgi:catechol 2,3-dioxygenase-like lactoylglutathione lyase family enzyme